MRVHACVCVCHHLVVVVMCVQVVVACSICTVQNLCVLVYASVCMCDPACFSA